MDSEQFFLKWNNFESNLASGFADLLQKEAMVDVTLAAEGKIVQAHKIILSVCSSYFRNMFQVNPCQHPIVILKDVRYQELADMLDFMYKGEANVRQEDLPSFLKLAETLKVKGLAGNQGEINGNSRKRNFESQISKLTKESSSFAHEEPSSNDCAVRDAGLRKKSKRCSSPLTCAETKYVPYSPDVKLEAERCDGGFARNNADDGCQNLVMKEERLSESSLDSYGENHVPESLEDEKNTGPPPGEENSESVPQEGRRRGKDYCFMESCFGGHLLILEGYVYRRKSVVSGRSYWNCCSPKCPAKGTLLSEGDFRLTNPRHSHEPDFENLKRRGKLLELKKLALQVDVPGQDLLQALHIEDDKKKHLGLVRTWRRRDKKKSGNSCAEPGLNVGVDYRLLPSRIPSKEMLLHSGYYFRQDSVNPYNDKCKYWRCRVKTCKARAKTDDAGNLTILKSVHNHASEGSQQTSPHSEQTIDTSAGREPAREAMPELYSARNEASRKLPWRAKREPVAAVEDTADSPFGPPDNFSFDKLMAETLDENYCVAHEFGESLNLLKNE